VFATAEHACPENHEPDASELYREMARIRVFEDKVQALFLQGLIPGTTHLYQGQEAVAVGVCSQLDDADAVAATYRGHGVALALGTQPDALFAELLGRETGVCGGRAGSMNVVDLEHRLLGCFAIVGGSIGCATGAALAMQLRGEPSVAVAFFGDGAVNQAYFHECLNFAGIRKLPILYVCENNLYGEWTPMGTVTAGGDIAARADAYALPGEKVDGNDVVAVRSAAGRALARARSGEGPTLLECLTYRHKGHSRSDPAKYRPAGELDDWLTRDPLSRLAGELPAALVETIQADVADELARAEEAALAAPFPAVETLVGLESGSSWPS
jgi:acetoin:2,6-dichlorophenolindophenol oxidoreductase subunit alpha